MPCFLPLVPFRSSACCPTPSLALQRAQHTLPPSRSVSNVSKPRTKPPQATRSSPPEPEREISSMRKQLIRLSKALSIPSKEKDAELLARLGAHLAADRRMPAKTEMYIRRSSKGGRGAAVNPFVRWTVNRRVYDWDDPELIESMVAFHDEEGRFPTFEEMLPDEHAVEWLLRSRTHFRSSLKRRLLSNSSDDLAALKEVTLQDAAKAVTPPTTLRQPDQSKAATEAESTALVVADKGKAVPDTFENFVADFANALVERLLWSPPGPNKVVVNNFANALASRLVWTPPIRPPYVESDDDQTDDESENVTTLAAVSPRIVDSNNTAQALAQRFTWSPIPRVKPFGGQEEVSDKATPATRSAADIAAALVANDEVDDESSDAVSAPKQVDAVAEVERSEVEKSEVEKSEVEEAKRTPGSAYSTRRRSGTEGRQRQLNLSRQPFRSLSRGHRVYQE